MLDIMTIVYVHVQIKSGEICATINQKDGMVLFADNQHQYDTPEVMQRIQQEITRVMELHKMITQKEESIMLNSAVSFGCRCVHCRGQLIYLCLFVCMFAVREKGDGKHG